MVEKTEKAIIHSLNYKLNWSTPLDFIQFLLYSSIDSSKLPEEQRHD
jgi:hypothetical protein